MEPGKRALLVGVGGFVGANARYWLALALAPRFGAAGSPWPTLAINLLGSLLLGLLIGGTRSEAARLLLGVGLLGGFTTFSTFALELTSLVEARDWVRAGLYAGASLVLGGLLAAAGLALSRSLLRSA